MLTQSVIWKQEVRTGEVISDIITTHKMTSVYLGLFINTEVTLRESSKEVRLFLDFLKMERVILFGLYETYLCYNVPLRINCYI